MWVCNSFILLGLFYFIYSTGGEENKNNEATNSKANPVSEFNKLSLESANENENSVPKFEIEDLTNDFGKKEFAVSSGVYIENGKPIPYYTIRNINESEVEKIPADYVEAEIVADGSFGIKLSRHYEELERFDLFVYLHDVKKKKTVRHSAFYWKEKQFIYIHDCKIDGDTKMEHKIPGFIFSQKDVIECIGYFLIGQFNVEYLGMLKEARNVYTSEMAKDNSSEYLMVILFDS